MAAPLIFPVFRAYTVAGTAPLNGGKLYSYVAGTSTPLATYTDSTLSVANANPTILDSSGTAAIWIGTSSYKFILKDSLDVTIWTADNVTESGVATQPTPSEWVQFSGAPTYVSATSFTLAGDQTSTFHIGRRIKTTNTGGTSYGTVVTSVFTTLTTITLFTDNGTLDSGLSVVYYGILDSVNRSVPYGTFTKMYMSAASVTITAGGFTTVPLDTVWQVDKLSEANTGTNRIVVKQSGFYLLMGNITWTCAASDQEYAGEIRINGSSNAAVFRVPIPASSGNATVGMSGMYQATAGDYFELQFDPTVANTDIIGGGVQACWLGAVRIA